MIRDLAEHGHWEALYGILDGRYTMAELHAAYQKGKPDLLELIARHSGKLLAPLFRGYSRQYAKRDALKTLRKIERFLEYVGARGEVIEEGMTPRAAKAKRKAWRERATSAEFTAQQIAEFLVSLEALNHGVVIGKASGGTKNRYRGALSGFATWLIRHHHIDTHPIAFKGVEKFVEDDHRLPDMTPAEYRDYFATVYAERSDLAVVLKLLIHAGPDIGEVFESQTRDYQLQGASPRVRFRRSKTYTPERLVPIPRTLAAELRGHIAAHGLKGDALIFGMFARRDVETQHRRAARSIGHPKLRIKDLRHIAAIYWRRSGEDLQTIQKRLGHASINQTMIYTDYLEDDEDASVGAEAAASLLTAETDVTSLQNQAQRRAIAT